MKAFLPMIIGFVIFSLIFSRIIPYLSEKNSSDFENKDQNVKHLVIACTLSAFPFLMFLLT